MTLGTWALAMAVHLVFQKVSILVVPRVENLVVSLAAKKAGAMVVK
jgi:hypothetical protein